MGCSSATCRHAEDGKVAETAQRQTPGRWVRPGRKTVQVVVRNISGNEVARQEMNADAPISEVAKRISNQMGLHRDTMQLCSGGQVFQPTALLTQCASDTCEGTVELTLVQLPGPDVAVQAMSGRNIKLMKEAPPTRCHQDRDYKFSSLGGFAHIPNVMYVYTSNEDKMTPSKKVMWKLEVRKPVVVYLNFRSDGHVSLTGASTWLRQQGWEQSKVRSTVSTGIPNGPYSGPVYQKSFDPGTIELMGSNCGEGVYFVFVEIQTCDVEQSV